jgi:hypothetical protein
MGKIKTEKEKNIYTYSFLLYFISIIIFFRAANRKPMCTIQSSILRTHKYQMLASILTYSMQQSPSWEANWFSASQETPHILFTAFTSARHLSLSWARSIQSIPPHPTSWRSILILSSLLRLGYPSGLFPSRFPTKTLYTPLLSPTRATCPDNLILGFITRTILHEEYRSLSPYFVVFSTPL